MGFAGVCGEEIKNMGTAKKVQGGWVIGGKKAVSDKVAKAGAAKFSEGGKSLPMTSSPVPAVKSTCTP
ncbi:hypothetical protein [Mobiluncus mulieris]|uniref:hypothetical protein n=1 Tax=Mobiluncus mulieris TaxID=2052 RepID=UPI000B6A5A77|nr:hypothetical protein [Mobiluncus mulieris]PNL40862.1 hypothetical protein CEP82_011545 [Mobiluncus mulieris]